MMISRFIQTLLFLICICTYTYSQTTTSFYVKVTNLDDVESARKSFKTKFSNAEITQPFARNTFDNLNHIIRIDGDNIYIDDIKNAIAFPIDYVENVPIGEISFTPNDLGIEFGSPNQWSLYRTNAQGAWNYSQGSSDVMIAVVDNAFLIDHPDLANKVRINNNEIPNDGIDNDNNGYIDDYAGWNSRNNNGDIFNVSTNSSHGTHVAGIAAAETNNQLGIASLSFLTQLLPIKAGDNNDNITHGYEAISFAAERGAKVINCSWGSFDSSITAKSVINFALSQDCFVVASCGNFANEVPVFPATYHGVISVASTTQSDAKLNTSSFSRRVNISAPGSGIWSTISTETAAPSYGFMSGTSMASPLTAALLALMSGYAPAGNDSVILECLYFTAADIYNIPANAAYDSLLGRGRIDAENAMSCLYSTLHLGLNDEHETFIVGIYPNPTSDLFYIVPTENMMPENIFWSIKNVSGQEIMNGKTLQGNISTLSGGVYYLSVLEKTNGHRQIFKLIKQ